MMKTLLMLAVVLCCVPSCIPLSMPKAEPPKSKAEQAVTAPRLDGVTVDNALAAFHGFTVTSTTGETADQHTATQTLGESSATVEVVSYAPDAVASVTARVHRPGHANGPMLDRLAAEHLPKALDVMPEGDRDAARSWLVGELMIMSASGHNAKTTIGTVDLSLTVIRGKATLRMTPVKPAAK